MHAGQDGPSSHDFHTSQPSDTPPSVKRTQPQLPDEGPTKQELHITPSTPSHLAGLLAQLEPIHSRNASVDAPRVVKVVRHIVYVACRLEHLLPSTAVGIDWDAVQYVSAAQFVACVGPDAEAVCRLAQVLDETPARLLEEARDCVVNYDPSAPSLLSEAFTLGELDEEVAAVTQLITPYLARLQPWACKVVKNYCEIKKLLPNVFRDA